MPAGTVQHDPADGAQEDAQGTHGDDGDEDRVQGLQHVARLPGDVLITVSRALVSWGAPWGEKRNRLHELPTYQMTVDREMEKEERERSEAHVRTGLSSPRACGGFLQRGFGSPIAKKHQRLGLTYCWELKVGGKGIGCWCCDSDRKLSAWKPLTQGSVLI